MRAAESTPDLIPVPRATLIALRRALDETINASVVIEGLHSMVDYDDGGQCSTCFQAIDYCIKAQSAKVCDASEALDQVFPRERT